MQLQPQFIVQTEIDRLSVGCTQLQRLQIAAATESGYAFDWRKFSAWCVKMERDSSPATSETLSLFITDLLLQGRKVSTVRRYAAGVAYTHRSLGLESPLTQGVKDLLRGAQRARCEQPRQMRPLTLDLLRQIAVAFSLLDTPLAMRDRSVVTLGFASALRRSNLAGLNLEDVESCRQGLTIHVRREKQDREGKGRLIGIPFAKEPGACPVKCLDAWVAIRGRHDGPVFTRLDSARRDANEGLSMNAIAGIVKGAICRICPSSLDRWSTHSLRAGFVVEAGLANVNPLVIARHTGHRSLESLQRYFRPADAFRANAFSALDV